MRMKLNNFVTNILFLILVNRAHNLCKCYIPKQSFHKEASSREFRLSLLVDCCNLTKLVDKRIFKIVLTMAISE